jgi:dTDP-6-deoxy-L-talose 4-dehydrogenase (NAD+)
MPRVLLTGATGFVGRKILSALQQSDADIRLVLRVGTETRLPDNAPQDRVITPDLFSENEAWWAEACRDIDTVIHAAWYMEPGNYLQSIKNIDCLQGTLRLARGAIIAGVCRFVGIGSCAEYDVSNGYLDINTPLKPKNIYASAKAAAYMLLSNWLPPQHVEFVWCRLFYLYGDGEDSRRLIPYLRKMLESGLPAELTSGKQIRDFLDVCEAGKMICQAAFSQAQGPINICSGVPITVRALAEKVADEYGRRDLLQFGIRQDNLFDPPFIVGIK